MALELMFDEMLRQLHSNSSSEMQVEEYKVLWNSAVASAGDPLPCPICFLAGKISRVIAIEEKNGISTVRCKSCRQTFHHPSPE